MAPNILLLHLEMANHKNWEILERPNFQDAGRYCHPEHPIIMFGCWESEVAKILYFFTLAIVECSSTNPIEYI